MKKKYLITKVVSGEKQLFVKSVSKDSVNWIEDHTEALSFLNLEDAENEKELVLKNLGTEADNAQYIRIIEL
jgi:hypothetical protein|uniref:Uncharacterized protein n=1 Tax=CrAss-like virus sp. ctt4r3 TaxID=2823619 RepID=A0A8S5L7D2_9CAUD|nr:MAG TPA: hypothetical protein [CrAss-like virus sp. ctt4r3]